jgi:hypothetical protein
LKTPLRSANLLPVLSLALLLLLQAPAYRVGPVQPATSAAQPYSPATGGYRIAPSAGEDEAGPASAPWFPPPQLARTGVTIDAYDRTVEARWGGDDPYYTSTIRGGAAIAQSRQGPLDGGWTVTAADGATLFALQLVDEGLGLVEGAWRDAAGARPGGARPEASGFIALASRGPGRAVLRFMEPGATTLTVISVAPSADGSWRGEVARGVSTATPVVMRRR